MRFVSLALHEPPKQEVLATSGAVVRYRNGPPSSSSTTGRQPTIEAVVSLAAGSSPRGAAGRRPARVMLEEFFAAEELARADPRWQEAMRKRGVTDFSLAMIDPWPAGYGTEDTRRRAG